MVISKSNNERMKIGILTQKLENNYGGILQNYALQVILQQLGHTPITIDFRPGDSVFWYVVSLSKTIIEKGIGKKIKIKSYSSTKTHRSDLTTTFIKNHIITTKRIHVLTPLLSYFYKLDGVIVGSDQVWRARYNVLRNTFLSFVKGNFFKLAYAASFGVSEWEYDEVQTKKCREWIRKFRAVSTREISGVRLCKEYLKCDAVHVLDPTMLLSAEKYSSICDGIECIHHKKFLFAYILDPSPEIRDLIRNFAKKEGLATIFLSAENNITKGIDYWLACFRDADYIITDSFHGSVFSIIFNKPFNTIINIDRGADRFISLLSLFGLEDRICSYAKLIKGQPIDWIHVNYIMKGMREKSINFLKENLK